MLIRSFPRPETNPVLTHDTTGATFLVCIYITNSLGGSAKRRCFLGPGDWVQWCASHTPRHVLHRCSCSQSKQECGNVEFMECAMWEGGKTIWSDEGLVEKRESSQSVSHSQSVVMVMCLLPSSLLLKWQPLLSPHCGRHELLWS